ncbi:MAG: hypothetical protein AABX34_03525 [Nanoarchaeota archaeon]
MRFPKDYVVWNIDDLGLEYNILPYHKNPHFFNIKEIKLHKEWYSKIFNESNTSKIYYIEYYGSPGYEVSIFIIKIKDDHFGPIKEKIKRDNLRKVKNSAGSACEQIFFFDNKKSVILNIGSVDDLGRNKAVEISKVVSKKLPNMEKFC